MHQAISCTPSENTAQLFNSCSIDELDWPNTDEANYTRRFFIPLMKEGIGNYISNVQGEQFIIKYRDTVLPILQIDGKDNNAYVCSPYGHYISYGLAALYLVQNPFMRKLYEYILKALGKLARFGNIDSVVFVNNWFFSTDLYPSNITEEKLEAILALLKLHYSDRPILFRSLNSYINSSLIQALGNQGFRVIASRHVFLSDGKDEAYFNTRITKSDLKLWNDKTFEVLDETQITEEDYPRLLQLYEMTYTTPIFQLNPHYTSHFLKLLIEQDLLKFKILKCERGIVGVVGFCVKDGVLLCPFFGFDKSHPQHNVLYRLLSTALLLEAKKGGWIFHQSAGASFYKKIRRAEGCLETMAVYVDHLPFKKKLAWKVLEALMNKFGAYYMEKY